MCQSPGQTPVGKRSFPSGMQFEKSSQAQPAESSCLFSLSAVIARQFGNNSFWGRPCLDRWGMPWARGSWTFPGNKGGGEKGGSSQCCSSPAPGSTRLPPASVRVLLGAVTSPAKCWELSPTAKTHIII